METIKWIINLDLSRKRFLQKHHRYLKISVWLQNLLVFYFILNFISPLFHLKVFFQAGQIPSYKKKVRL